MKTTSKKLGFVLLAIVMTLSCKKDSENSDDRKSTNRLKMLVKQEAKMHNIGMEAVNVNSRNDKPSKVNKVSSYDMTPPQLAAAVYNDVNDYVISLPSNSHDPMTVTPIIVPLLEGVFTYGSDTYIQAQYADAISDIQPHITSMETGMVNQITSIFSTAQSQNLNQYQTYIYVKNELETLNSSHANTVFTGLQGEAFTGLVEVAMESNEFWAGFTPNPYTGVDIHTNTSSMIQLDLIGYIIGWLVAVNDDIDNGTLTKERQIVRIKAGILGALAGSVGGKEIKR